MDRNRWLVAALALLLATGCQTTSPETLRVSLGQKPPIAHTQRILLGETSLSKRYALRIHTGQGWRFEYYLRVPRGVSKPIPAVLVLAGFETGRQALDFLDERDDVILLSMDYPYEGPSEFKGFNLFRAVPSLRRMGLATVEAGSLALDYFWEQPQVDRDKIILIGVSFGSIFTTILGGLDRRARAVVLIYGGGDLPLLIQRNLRGEPWWLPPFVIPPLVRAFFDDFEPLRFVEWISPRLLLMINSRQDEFFPAASTEALFQRAKEPKKLIWYETGHMDLFDPSLIRRLTQEVVKELRNAGYFPPPDPY